MKVAFVNQAIDTIIPPGQNSVGACTYGVANILAKSCDVVVYGARCRNQAQEADFSAHGVKYKFFTTARSDRWLFDRRLLDAPIGTRGSEAHRFFRRRPTHLV